jgi:transcriptional regulator with GAF, ATPase, and Fis domain
MSIRFTPHALRRLQERFPGRVRELVHLVERGIAGPCHLARQGRWEIRGRIGGRTATVIVEELAPAEFCIVTVMLRPW